MDTTLITCPECSTRYEVSTAEIGPQGRQVRCVECGANWFVGPQAVPTDPDILALQDNQDPPSSPPESPETQHDAAAPDTATPPISPETSAVNDETTNVIVEPANIPPLDRKTLGADVYMRDQADAAKLARRQRTIAIIWTVPLILVILAGILGYIYRQPIVNRIPQSATLYQALGIEVKEGGLLIDPPIAKTAMLDGRMIITVEGHVRNISGRAQTVPLIEMTLHDQTGQMLTQWYVEPAQDTLNARERLAFRTEYSDPPGSVVGLRYRFAKRS